MMVPVVATVMTVILCLLNQAVAAGTTTSVSRALLQSPNTTKEEEEGLSTGALVGIIVGSVLGGLLVLLLIVLLARCLCQRRKIVSTNPPENPSGPPSETKTRSSGWKWFRKSKQPTASRRAGAPVPPPALLGGGDKMDPEEMSDTSFVLPELGGPNPHNKFDGMEWVDIKGMDDDVLVEISTDLRKYQQRQ